MKFLVDANLAERVARVLQAAGHEAVHVRALGMGRATDTEIFDKAVEAVPLVRAGATSHAGAGCSLALVLYGKWQVVGRENATFFDFDR